MEELDIFADLEKTLCESILNFTRKDRPLNTYKPSEQDLIDYLESVKDLGLMHGPAIGAYNLYKATIAFKEKRYLDSVYCEAFALSLAVRIKFHANKVMEADRHMPTEGNLLDLLDRRMQEEKPLIIDYIDRYLRNNLIDEKMEGVEFANGTELIDACKKLPKEWTVIQLCKQVNLKVFDQSYNETLRCPCLIFMTLFCYPMSERFNHQPIKIVLNQHGLEELYDTYRNHCEDIDSLANNWKSMNTTEFNSNLVSKLKKLLGPWIVLFSGKAKDQKVKSYENKMIAKVDKFLFKSKHKYSPLQNVLICLIARRLFMLTEDDINNGALYISTTKDEWFELMDFFYEQNPVVRPPYEYYPVILVVDEQIDFFFWEMCNPKQEFTRVESMVTLLKLYFLHQDKISKGYFNVKQRRGSAVLNPDTSPDRNVRQFGTNIHPLIERFKNPTWKILIGKKPTSTEVKTMLANSDIYIYCGHGSGLQYISAYETCQLYTNAVVFLMGCSSVAFKADRGYALGSAAHQYYHFAKSPAVIGHLNLTYSNYGSIHIDTVLTKWLHSTTNIDSKWFPEDQAEFVKDLQYTLKATKESKYLTKVIAECRENRAVAILYRAMLCYCGLPVCLNGN